MISLADSVVTGMVDGRFNAMLLNYCRKWRKNPTSYIVDNAVTHFIEALDHQNLFEILTDHTFRLLKKQQCGTNALRADLQKGADFFTGQYPDLLRYIQILFLEQRADQENAESSSIHLKYCADFSDFLQLDVPQGIRQDIGVHKVINHTFPITLKDQLLFGEITSKSPKVELLHYELGVWRCRCGGLIGHKKRFDYQCECNIVQGNGLIDLGVAACSSCGQYPDYVRCPSCGTRVKLDLLWRLQEGGLHPGDLRIPLDVALIIKQLGEADKELHFTLMHFPLMLGIRERDDFIVLEPPALFWLDSMPNQDYKAPSEDGQIFALPDSIKYDRQRELRKILEAMMRRTLLTYGSRDASLKEQIEKIVFMSKEEHCIDVDNFQKRLGRITSFQRPLDFMRMVDNSIDCNIAASPLLNDNMVFVNEDLVRRGSFSVSFFKNEVAIIKDSREWQDVLTPTPLGKTRPPWLENDGIVRVGAFVKTGDTLVGIESRKSSDEPHTPEEKLLAAIFGRVAEVRKKDSSLVFHGTNTAIKTAQVVAVRISVDTCWKGVHINGGWGRSVNHDKRLRLRHDEVVSIVVTLAIKQMICVGDILSTDDGNEAVVCRIASGASLKKMGYYPVEPDLMVSPNHPWAPQGNDDVRSIPVGLRGNTLLAWVITSRSVGSYQLIQGRPHGELVDTHPAQKIYSEDLDWLFAYDAPDIAFELFGPHCDCKSLRYQMYENAVEGKVRLADLVHEYSNLPQDLSRSPSETIRYVTSLLLGLGIKITVISDFQPKLAFHIMTEKEILAESRGEVKRSATINYRTNQPERDGIFCETIFGPTKDWQCHCGKYHRARYNGVVCEKCGVEVTLSAVRSERIGRISMPIPLVHPLYLTTVCDYLASKYQLEPKDLIDIIYCKKRLKIDSCNTLELKTSIIGYDEIESTSDVRQDDIQYFQGGFAVRKLLECLHSSPGNFSENSENWQGSLIESIVVIPPNHRPIIKIPGGRFATSDLNDHYIRIVSCRNRLKRLIEIFAPEVIIHNEQRMLQEAVDRLFNNLQCVKPLTGGYQNRPLKSLAELITDLAGNSQHLLHGLLERRVDFSAQTRIVVGNTEDIDTVLLPELLAWELLQPLVLKKLRENLPSLKRSKIEFLACTTNARMALELAASEAIVLAATFSSSCRLVAFRPKLTSNMALTIHPDLMNFMGWENLGKHVRLFTVLSEEAKQEAQEKLLPSRLCQGGTRSRNHANIKQLKNKSAFWIEKENLVAELAWRALVGTVCTLELHDRLSLCIREDNIINV